MAAFSYQIRSFIKEIIQTGKSCLFLPIAIYYFSNPHHKLILILKDKQLKLWYFPTPVFSASFFSQSL